MKTLTSLLAIGLLATGLSLAGADKAKVALEARVAALEAQAGQTEVYIEFLTQRTDYLKAHIDELEERAIRVRASR